MTLSMCRLTEATLPSRDPRASGGSAAGAASCSRWRGDDAELQTNVRDCEPSCGHSFPALAVTLGDTEPGGTC